MILDRGTRGCLLLLVALAGAFYLYSRSENKKRQEQELKLKKRGEAVKAIGAALIERTGASRDWEKVLIASDPFNNVRHDLRTIDVQRAWITGRPLFFSGELVDVAALGTDTIEIRLRNHSSVLQYGMGKRLQMRIRCSEQVVPNLMNIIEGAKKRPSGIVAAVLVKEVRGEVDEAGTELDDLRFVGLADCLDMVPTSSLPGI